jgi:hypothetical protein
MKDKLIAFDDSELIDWLMDLIENEPENSLCLFAEAALTANAEDYSVIRPGLIELKRKHCARNYTQLPAHRLSLSRRMQGEIQSTRSQMQ